MKGNSNNITRVSLVNKAVGIRLNLEFNISELPYLTQWKMMGNSEYVLGLEPCNVLCKSRKQLRDENSLPFLAPGKSVSNKLKISVEEI
jgi:hypothetical protein